MGWEGKGRVMSLADCTVCLALFAVERVLFCMLVRAAHTVVMSSVLRVLWEGQLRLCVTFWLHEREGAGRAFKALPASHRETLNLSTLRFVLV